MSISVGTDVHCDGCGAWIRGYIGVESARRAARREAREFGWTFRRNRDYCPDCSASGNS